MNKLEEYFLTEKSAIEYYDANYKNLSKRIAQWILLQRYTKPQECFKSIKVTESGNYIYYPVLTNTIRETGIEWLERIDVCLSFGDKCDGQQNIIGKENSNTGMVVMNNVSYSPPASDYKLNRAENIITLYSRGVNEPTYVLSEDKKRIQRATLLFIIVENSWKDMSKLSWIIMHELSHLEDALETASENAESYNEDIIINNAFDPTVLSNEQVELIVTNLGTMKTDPDNYIYNLLKKNMNFDFISDLICGLIYYLNSSEQSARVNNFCNEIEHYTIDELTIKDMRLPQQHHKEIFLKEKSQTFSEYCVIKQILESLKKHTLVSIKKLIVDNIIRYFAKSHRFENMIGSYGSDFKIDDNYTHKSFDYFMDLQIARIDNIFISMAIGVYDLIMRESNRPNSISDMVPEHYNVHENLTSEIVCKLLLKIKTVAELGYLNEIIH